MEIQSTAKYIQQRYKTFKQSESRMIEQENRELDILFPKP